MTDKVKRSLKGMSHTQLIAMLMFIVTLLSRHGSSKRLSEREEAQIFAGRDKRAKRKGRKPSPYNLRVGALIKSGKTFKQAAKEAHRECHVKKRK